MRTMPHISHVMRNLESGLITRIGQTALSILRVIQDVEDVEGPAAEEGMQVIIHIEFVGRMELDGPKLSTYCQLVSCTCTKSSTVQPSLDI